MKKSKLIKVVIADDHELYRDGLKLMLSKQKQFRLIGEMENGVQLVNCIDELNPDIIITDIKMPEMDGIEATKKIAQAHPKIGIIALSMFDNDYLVVEMLEAGAKGYLLKNANKEVIAEAIITVHNRRPYYCKETSMKLANLIANSSFNPYENTPKASFTPKEIEIIEYTCKEFTSKKIAEKMFLSVRTIEGIKSKIETKMNVNGNVGLVIYAVKNGLVKL